MEVSILTVLTRDNNTDLGEHNKRKDDEEKQLSAMVFLEGNQWGFYHHTLHVLRFLKHGRKLVLVRWVTISWNHLSTRLSLPVCCLS